MLSDELAAVSRNSTDDGEDEHRFNRPRPGTPLSAHGSPPITSPLKRTFSDMNDGELEDVYEETEQEERAWTVEIFGPDHPRRLESIHNRVGGGDNGSRARNFPAAGQAVFKTETL